MKFMYVTSDHLYGNNWSGKSGSPKSLQTRIKSRDAKWCNAVMQLWCNQRSWDRSGQIQLRYNKIHSEAPVRVFSAPEHREIWLFSTGFFEKPVIMESENASTTRAGATGSNAPLGNHKSNLTPYCVSINEYPLSDYQYPDTEYFTFDNMKIAYRGFFLIMFHKEGGAFFMTPPRVNLFIYRIYLTLYPNPDPFAGKACQAHQLSLCSCRAEHDCIH